MDLVFGHGSSRPARSQVMNSINQTFRSRTVSFPLLSTEFCCQPSTPRIIEYERFSPLAYYVTYAVLIHDGIRNHKERSKANEQGTRLEALATREPGKSFIC